MQIQPIILAAGKGTRMGGELPKVLTPLHGRPMVSHLLNKLQFMNLPHRTVIVVGYKSDVVTKVLGQDFSYALQEPQLGTGHAVMQAQEQITAPHVAVLNGDHPLTSLKFLETFFARHIDSGTVMTMTATTLPDFNDWRSTFAAMGRILRDDQGKVVAIREYKDASESERAVKEVNVGLYVFETKWLFEQLGKIGNNNAQGEYYLTDVAALALATGHNVSTVDMDPAEALGVNSPEHLEFAAKLVPGGLAFAT